MADAAQPPFRILALAGGGYLGLYTACVLAELEECAGEPLGRRFDLIAGTSVGGILALALAYEIPMTRLKDLFLEHGQKIFSARGLPSNAVAKLRDLSRAVLGPKYNGVALAKALAVHLGKRTLADALHPIVVPAVDVTRSRTKIFKTPHVDASRGDEEVRAAHVAMATSAAPAYFPSVRIGDALYADGGLFAVAPDQVALHEATHFMGVDESRIRMLSLGTGTANYRPADAADESDGAVDWLSDGRLILTLISVQQQHVQAMMEDRLRDRYLHLDADWPIGAELGIDIATDQATRVLIGLAGQTVAEPILRKVERQFLQR
ncbi:MAG: patatin-like phospholipase family protein [Xanthomonadales bacterium]|nr:patatin-like phospholipase family protein [Xanthomonadales bacterium]MBK7143669.1 patatin-like phospholipase family protein [Xanthomonadales bacterium]MCC6561525.1 patatin-like phospholipase family protein [Xanthomonadales bacterium]